MKYKSPLVSVVVSSYNSEEFIEESLMSLLDQSFEDFELLVVNDASTDNSLEIIQKLQEKDNRIKILNNEVNIGLTRSLNKAIKVANGKYIARQDADDISYSTRLEKQVNYMEKNNNIVLLGSRHIDIIEDQKQESKYISFEKINNDIYMYNPIAHSSAMFRKDIFRNIGLYDETYLTSQDFDAWIRLAQVGKIAMLDEILVERKIHHNSISAKKHFTQIKNSLRAKFIHSNKNKLITFVLVSRWILYVVIRNILHKMNNK